MRRKAISIVFFLFAVGIPAFSQEEFMTSWAKVSMNDLSIKECSFDKEATAIVLLDEAMSNYDDQYQLITNRHIRIKILKEKGINHANIAITYYRKDDFEFISNVEAIIHSPDGLQSTQVERKSIFNKPTTSQLGEVRFTFPDVKVGSIIEYRYQSTMKHYGGLDEWCFQSELPVLRSYYNLTLLPNSEFAYMVHKNSDLPVKIEPNNSNGSISFEMKQVPSLDEEPYMDSRRDYLQRVAFQLSRTLRGGRYMTSWEEMIRKLLSEQEFGGQLNKELSGTDEFIKMAKTISSPAERIRLVYEYVRKNMSATTYGGIYSIDGIKSAWNKKQGTAGEVNLVLVNLLKAAGLDAHPVLISERWHGKVDPTAPMLDQFQVVYACVLTDQKTYYLDAVNKYTPFNIIPYEILNTNALVVNRKKGGIVNISDESLMFRETLNISGTISREGKMNGEMFMNSIEYAKVHRKEESNQNAGNHFVRNFQQSLQGVTFDDYSIKNENNDSLPLELRCKYSLPLNATGVYLFIPLNTFTDFNKNPFVSDNRFSNINFGYKKNYAVTIMLDIPEGYTVDVLPKPIRLSDPERTIMFTRSTQYDQPSNKVRCSFLVECNRSLYRVEDYSMVKAFYKQMFDLLNEQVVLKKKANP